VNRQTSSRD